MNGDIATIHLLDINLSHVIGHRDLETCTLAYVYTDILLRLIRVV